MEERKRQEYLLIGVACVSTVGRPLTFCYFIATMLTSYNLWSVVFCLFGVHWVMPKKEVELLECQKGALANIMLLMYVGTCVLVLCGPFRGRETFLFWWNWAFICGAKILSFTNHVWLLAALSGHSFSTLEEFLDLCNFGWRFIASQVHNLCTWGSFLFIFNKALLIKKKKRRKNTSTNPIVRTRWIRADNNCKQGRKWSHPVNAHIPVSQEKLPAVPYVQPMCHPFPCIGSIHQMC